MFSAVTKKSYELTSVEDTCDVLEEAVNIALGGRPGPVLGLRLDRHRVLAGRRDLRPGTPEVEPRGQLLRGLVERVVELLPVDLADDVERGICHVASPVWSGWSGVPTVPVCTRPTRYRYPYLRCGARVRCGTGGLPERPMGADCKSVAKATKVRILHPPQCRNGL